MNPSQHYDYNMKENKDPKEDATTTLIDHPRLPTSYEFASFLFRRLWFRDERISSHKPLQANTFRFVPSQRRRRKIWMYVWRHSPILKVKPR